MTGTFKAKQKIRRFYKIAEFFERKKIRKKFGVFGIQLAIMTWKVVEYFREGKFDTKKTNLN
jgi:hypothetical protein